MKDTVRIASICALVLGLVLPLFAQEGWHFTLRPEESRFTVDVGRAGFLKVFSHDHVVEIRGFSGEVDWNPDEEELARIQTDMEVKALDVENYLQILFVSEELTLSEEEGDERRGRVTGQITLRGVTNTVTIPLTLTVSEESLRAQGEFQIKGSDFGIDPISAAGGSVKTKDQLELTFDLVGARE